MTTYDDHADLLGEECEHCGETNAACKCQAFEDALKEHEERKRKRNAIANEY